LRIAIVAPYDLARHGGIASHIRAQGRALTALGHAVRIFGPASKPLTNGETAVAGSTTVTFGGTSSGAAFNPTVFQRVAALFAAEPFDVVHVHEPLMPLLPWAAVWAATAPVVATFHVYRETGHRWYPLARPLLQSIVNRIDARIAVSEAARRTVEAFFPGHYEIIPNGIETERFQTKQPRPAAFPASGPVVVCVGRLEPRKGVNVLIEAMPRVRQVAGAALVLVGDGPERATLEERARQLNVRTTIIRNVDDDALPAFYQHATVVCAPATSGESFGIVLIEALAARAPVVASRIDGYVDAVGEDSGVRWAVPGDSGDLARQLIAQIEHRDSTDETLRVGAKYDWLRIAGHLTETYSRVTSNEQRAASDEQTSN